MTIQKAANAAHETAGQVIDAASDAAKTASKAAGESLDKAGRRLHSVQDSVDPLIDGLAAKAQEFATRSIDYCAQASDRARRQFNDATDATYRYVSDQPGKSLLLAAAAGAALAAAMMATRGRGSRH